jgi:Undecaprenyl-phosphate glucose phosphotransferase
MSDLAPEAVGTGLHAGFDAAPLAAGASDIRRTTPVRTFSSGIAETVLRLAEIVCLLGALAVPALAGMVAPEGVLPALIPALALWLVVSRRSGYPSPTRLKRLHGLGAALAGWAGVMVLLWPIMLLLKTGLKNPDAYSPFWFLSWLVAGMAGLILCRGLAALAFAWLEAQGALRRRVVILGAGPLGLRLARRIESNPDTGLALAGHYDDAGVGVQEALTTIGETGTDCVVIALPLTEEARIAELVEELRGLAVDVSLAMDFGVSGGPTLAGIPIFVAAERPLQDWQLFVKRVEDCVVAGLALLVFGPLLGLAALAIRLDSPGPVFFRQPRRGFNQRIFSVYKFRTMYVEHTDVFGNRLVSRGDTRVTRVGKWLRKTSIDEVPQLFNVLQGDMSIVGPRPHPLNAKAGERLYPDVVPRYPVRHRMKPGITGWAQVNGWRGETDTEEKIERRVEHDLYYIDNWSPLFDLKVILMTFTLGLWSKNAF